MDFESREHSGSRGLSLLFALAVVIASIGCGAGGKDGREPAFTVTAVADEEATEPSYAAKHARIIIANGVYHRESTCPSLQEYLLRGGAHTVGYDRGSATPCRSCYPPPPRPVLASRRPVHHVRSYRPLPSGYGYLATPPRPTPLERLQERWRQEELLELERRKVEALEELRAHEREDAYSYEPTLPHIHHAGCAHDTFGTYAGTDYYELERRLDRYFDTRRFERQQDRRMERLLNGNNPLSGFGRWACDGGDCNWEFP